jgi:hypothetical protein
MIFVVVEEAFQRRNRIIIRTSPTMVCWGFIVMMVLDVALGRILVFKDTNERKRSFTFQNSI